MSSDPATADDDRFAPHDRLIPWLDQHVPEIGNGPLRTRLIAGGASNIVIGLDRGGATAVLRRQPANRPPNSEKGIAREARILKALNSTDVLHPHLYAYCADEGVIGANFYVMEMINGWSGQVSATGTVLPELFEKPEHLYALGMVMTDGLVALSRVDYQSVGLSDFGRPDGFLDRQVDRWLKQLGSYKALYKNYEGRTIPGLDEVAAWLRAHQPPMSAAGIVHGDYALSNAMFDSQPPVRMLAIVDWELATIGDPLIDLGGWMVSLRDQREPTRIPKAAYFDPTHFPTRQEVAVRYAQGSGRDVSQYEYYIVLAMFRYACVVEYKVAEAMAGLAPAAKGEWFARAVLDLIDDARQLTERIDSRS